MYLADNGSTHEEVARTATLCADLSAAYRRDHPEYMHPGDINCGRSVLAPPPPPPVRSSRPPCPLSRGHRHRRVCGTAPCSIGEGSKNLAQFCTAYNILMTCPDIKYITALDDDTLLPDGSIPSMPTAPAPHPFRHALTGGLRFRSTGRGRRVGGFDRAPPAWSEDEVIALFTSDAAIGSVAYPLRASNRDYMLARFQDMEYLTAGFSKIAQVGLAVGGVLPPRKLCPSC